jgi:hypothetical protein
MTNASIVDVLAADWKRITDALATDWRRLVGKRRKARGLARTSQAIDTVPIDFRRLVERFVADHRPDTRAGRRSDRTAGRARGWPGVPSEVFTSIGHG